MHRYFMIPGIILICFTLQSCSTNSDLEKRIAELENKIKKYDEVISLETGDWPHILLKSDSANSKTIISPGGLIISNQKKGTFAITNFSDRAGLLPGPAIIAYDSNSSHLYSLGFVENEGAIFNLTNGYESDISFFFANGIPSLQMNGKNKRICDLGSINVDMVGLRICNDGEKPVVIITTPENDGAILLSDRYGDLGWYQDGKK